MNVLTRYLIWFACCYAHHPCICMAGHYVQSFFSYYETTSSDVIERNSTELRRVFENKSDLKIHVQNVELNSEQPPIFGWFYEDIDRDLSENMFGSRLGNSWYAITIKNSIRLWQLTLRLAMF